MFTTLKQSDNRKPARLLWTRFDYDYGPNGTLVNPRQQSSIETTVGLLGNQRTTWCNKGTYWVPGKFAVSPIDQRSVNTTCTSGELKIHTLWSGKSYLAHILTGELGAWLGIPASGSVFDPAVTYPDLGMDLLARASASASQASLEAGVMLGELKETLSMLANPLGGLVKLLKRNPIPKLKRFKRALRGTSMKDAGMYLSNWWLQMRFGVMPFLNDISDIASECQKKVYKEFPIQHSRALNFGGKVQTREPYQGIMFNVPVWGDSYAAFTQRTMATVYYNRFQWDYRERLGLHWSQFPSTVWELVPFSFLVDRVVNIGQWLELMRPKQNFTILGSTLSYKETSENGFHAKSAQLNPYTDHRTTIDHICRTTCEKYVRTVPGPLPTWPTVNLNLSGLVKTLDHLTLLNQIILNRITR